MSPWPAAYEELRFNTVSGLRTHQKTPKLADFYKVTAEEKLLEKETVVKIVKSEYGFHVWSSIAV